MQREKRSLISYIYHTQFTCNREKLTLRSGSRRRMIGLINLGIKTSAQTPIEMYNRICNAHLKTLIYPYHHSSQASNYLYCQSISPSNLESDTNKTPLPFQSTSLFNLQY